MLFIVDRLHVLAGSVRLMAIGTRQLLAIDMRGFLAFARRRREHADIDQVPGVVELEPGAILPLTVARLDGQFSQSVALLFRIAFKRFFPRQELRVVLERIDLALKDMRASRDL